MPVCVSRICTGHTWKYSWGNRVLRRALPETSSQSERVPSRSEPSGLMQPRLLDRSPLASESLTSEAELVASVSLLLDSDAVGLAAVCCTSESVVLACAKLEIFVADAAAGVGIPPTLWATGDADGIPPLPEDSNGPFASSLLCLERAVRISDGVRMLKRVARTFY